MRFRPNQRAIASLMKSDQARAAVLKKAEQIAEAAAGEGDDFRTDSGMTGARWRAAVIGNYSKHRDAEGTRSKLLRGLDGAK
ncbi:hypothetical protein [Streptomyces sp. NBC_01207]|uniref:hypothetical protein n=1 Tax=Streptomyces sp. NBC_01207 TaxID=2903772 RepID=UPI002E0DBECA|nr:hypothetical protein OG457_31200 [Streptomyces sp. NBC_01207]